MTPKWDLVSSQSVDVGVLQRKRKTVCIDLTGEDDSEGSDGGKRRKLESSEMTFGPRTPKKSFHKKSNPSTPKSTKKSPKYATPEKRLRRWRDHAPSPYSGRYARALNQRTNSYNRMFVLDRSRNTNGDTPSELITMAGSTGNLYTVTISKISGCTCPDYIKGNMCKHIIYSLARVLKAPRHLQYQLALLSSELDEIFAAAPLPTDEVTEEEADTEHPSNRKEVSGDCPICFCDMAEDDPADVVWCKAACGNNVHKNCFQRWAKSGTGIARCVYCRANWENEEGSTYSSGTVIIRDGRWMGSREDLATLRANAIVGEDGYENVGEELGLDVERDTSTYHYSGRYGRRSRNWY